MAPDGPGMAPDGPGMAPDGPGMAPDGPGMAPIHKDKSPDTHTSIGQVVTLEMDHDFGFDDGLICGGQMDVAVTLISRPEEAQAFREAAVAVRAGKPAILPVRVTGTEGPVEYRVQIEASPKLVIAGGGHVGRALATLMAPLGFHVTVIDDRREFANADRFPAPINPVAADIAETLASRPIDPNTYVVIVTRGHKHDEQALSAVLDSPAKYLGMIGSHRKIQVIFDDLKHAGATQQQLDRVHSPIGLSIKAVTPEEIAVSIAAELIAVRRADHRKAVEGPIMLTDHAT
jgi:xanthine/CO dehydrogenase XdhC/CoxF family maturation factor